jgi:hypothetical protein
VLHWCLGDDGVGSVAEGNANHNGIPHAIRTRTTSYPTGDYGTRTRTHRLQDCARNAKKRPYGASSRAGRELAPCFGMQQPSSRSSRRKQRLSAPAKNGVDGHVADLSADIYPVNSHVDVFWHGDKAWYTAKVLHTRAEIHKVNGNQTLCREIFCRYELDGLEKWHALYNNTIRTGTLPSARQHVSTSAAAKTKNQNDLTTSRPHDLMTSPPHQRHHPHNRQRLTTSRPHYHPRHVDACVGSTVYRRSSNSDGGIRLRGEVVRS